MLLALHTLICGGHSLRQILSNIIKKYKKSEATIWFDYSLEQKITKCGDSLYWVILLNVMYKDKIAPIGMLWSFTLATFCQISLKIINISLTLQIPNLEMVEWSIVSLEFFWTTFWSNVWIKFWMKPETMNEFLDEFGLIFFGHSAGETFCGWIWLNEVDGRRSMASINYYKSFYWKIFWTFVLMNFW